MLEWEWYDDPKVFKFFIHCLFRCNHKPKKWRGVDIQRGQFVSSLDILSKETNLSVQQVRTCLKKLKSTGELTSKPTSKFSLITVCNYLEYQSVESESNRQNNKQPNNELTSKQQTSNRQATTNKNDKNSKNEKNVRNIFTKPTIQEVKTYCLEKKINIDPEQFWNWYESNGWRVGKNPMKNWKACVQTWKKNNNSVGQIRPKESQALTRQQILEMRGE